jgi:hypothetical protein
MLLLPDIKVHLVLHTDESKSAWIKEIVLPFAPNLSTYIELDSEFGPILLKLKEYDQVKYHYVSQTFIITHFFKPFYGHKRKDGEGFVTNVELLKSAGFREEMNAQN